MKHEMDYLENNQTWDLIPPLAKNNGVKCRWVYQTKFTSNDAFQNHKALLILKGFSKQEGIKYIKTFSYVAKMNSFQLIL